MKEYCMKEYNLVRWIPALLWMGFIFMLSHQPKYQLEPMQPSAFIPNNEISWTWLMNLLVGAELDTIAGKSAHVVVYAVLAWLLWLAYPQPYFVLWFTTIFGLSDEVHQLFIFGRTGRLFDVLFDALGAVLAVLWLARGSFAPTPSLRAKQVTVDK